jgi:metal-responsive CopG/Arc/MetJ family transcriptional regulator
MRTIAITIDERTLNNVDRIASRQGMNRSEFMREAAQEYVALKDLEAEEEKERKIFRKHRKKLKKQTSILIKEQAKI